VRQLPGRGLVETICGHLGQRPVLLLLDNLEHVLPVTHLLLELLAACPRLRLLVTSRTSLSLRDEHVVTVSPLALAEAVGLFVQRVSARLPAFTLDDRNRSTVAEVCGRLDGLPLALELAAAWLELLGPDGLLARLAHPLSLLERSPADLPERQRTLRHTLRWSHDLLGADGQAAFRRLAVFAVGATLDAAELVCQAPGPLAGGYLPALAELVDHHLVVAEGGPESRVTMLHVVREFARELLDASGERAAAEAARLGHLSALVRGADPGLAGERQSAWFERLAREHQDLCGALDWAVEHDVEEGLRLATGLVRYWDVRGHCEEGDGWLERLLATGAPVPPDLRAESLYVSGCMRLRLSRYAACDHRFRAARDLFELAGDRAGAARALNGMATAELRQGRGACAIGMFEEALAHHRALGDRLATATVLDNLGLATKHEGDLARAMALHLEALEIRRTAGDRFGVCMTLNNLSDVACMQGSYEEAEGWLAEGVALARQLGARRSLSSAVGLQGELASVRGAHAEAAAHYRECLRISGEIGEPLNVIRALGDLALTTARQGSDLRAARLAGATVSLREAYGMPHPAVARPEWDAVLARVEDRIGRVAYRAAWAAGGALTIAEAMAEAAAQ
jgi:predicted ATPase